KRCGTRKASRGGVVSNLHNVVRLTTPAAPFKGMGIILYGASTPPLEAYRHPYLGALDTGGGRRCGARSLYMSVMPERRSRPRQRDFVPGCPSPLRPRCPPRAPTMRMASPRSGAG